MPSVHIDLTILLMRNLLIKIVKINFISLFLLFLISLSISCNNIEVCSYYGVTLDYLLSQRKASNLEPVDVVILAGQSNMAGIGSSEECFNYLSTSEYQQVKGGVDGVYIYACNDYIFMEKQPAYLPYSEVTFGYGAFPDKIGPEVGFALECQKAGRKLVIIKYTAISMGIDYFSNSIDISDFMKGYILTCLKDLIDKGYYPIVRATCWMHGEADCSYFISASAYYEKEKALINYLRNNFNENLLFIDAKIIDWVLLFPNCSQDLLNENKECIAQSDDLCFLIDTTGLKKGYDMAHYDTPSNIELGRRFAKEFLANYEKSN